MPISMSVARVCSWALSRMIVGVAGEIRVIHATRRSMPLVMYLRKVVSRSLMCAALHIFTHNSDTPPVFT
jgi:hypothetical protein